MIWYVKLKIFWPAMTDSPENATQLKSTNSRNSDSSISRSTNLHWDFGLIWICTEFEFLDLVDFGVAAFSVESVIWHLKYYPAPIFMMTHTWRKKAGGSRVYGAWALKCEWARVLARQIVQTAPCPMVQCMSVSVRVFFCVCEFVCVCVKPQIRYRKSSNRTILYIGVCACACVCKCVCVCVCVCICACVCVLRTAQCPETCIYMCIYVYMNIYMCICIYIYIRIHLNI